MSADPSPHPGDIYGHWREHCAELEARYPEQFAKADLGVSWADGWHAIVAGVCAYAAEREIPVRWRQIKEKLGGLRMYAHGGPMPVDISTPEGVIAATPAPKGPRTNADLYAKIKEAEAASLRTCCLCGTTDAAADAKQRTFNGWWLTACDACAGLIQAYCDLPPSQR